MHGFQYDSNRICLFLDYHHRVLSQSSVWYTQSFLIYNIIVSNRKGRLICYMPSDKTGYNPEICSHSILVEEPCKITTMQVWTTIEISLYFSLKRTYLTCWFNIKIFESMWYLFRLIWFLALLINVKFYLQRFRDKICFLIKFWIGDNFNLVVFKLAGYYYDIKISAKSMKHFNSFIFFIIYNIYFYIDWFIP